METSRVYRFFPYELLDREPRRSKTDGGLLLPLLERSACDSLCAESLFESSESASRSSVECSEFLEGSSSVLPSLSKTETISFDVPGEGEPLVFLFPEDVDLLVLST